MEKEDELKALKMDVVALERKIQLTLAPPKPEDGQEQTEGVQQANEQQHEQPSQTVKLDTNSDFIRDHVLVVRPGISDEQRQSGKHMKL